MGRPARGAVHRHCCHAAAAVTSRRPSVLPDLRGSSSHSPRHRLPPAARAHTHFFAVALCLSVSLCLFLASSYPRLSVELRRHPLARRLFTGGAGGTVRRAGPGWFEHFVMKFNSIPRESVRTNPWILTVSYQRVTKPRPIARRLGVLGA